MPGISGGKEGWEARVVQGGGEGYAVQGVLRSAPHA